MMNAMAHAAPFEDALDWQCQWHGSFMICVINLIAHLPWQLPELALHRGRATWAFQQGRVLWIPAGARAGAGAGFPSPPGSGGGWHRQITAAATHTRMNPKRPRGHNRTRPGTSPGPYPGYWNSQHPPLLGCPSGPAPM